MATNATLLGTMEALLSRLDQHKLVKIGFLPGPASLTLEHLREVVGKLEIAVQRDRMRGEHEARSRALAEDAAALAGAETQGGPPEGDPR